MAVIFSGVGSHRALDKWIGDPYIRNTDPDILTGNRISVPQEYITGEVMGKLEGKVASVALSVDGGLSAI